MSTSDVPASQIQILADAMDKDPKLAAQFKALMGIKSDELEEPSPRKALLPSTSHQVSSTTGTDKNSGKKPRPEQSLDENDANSKQEVESASDILALVHDVVLPRRIKFVESTFVPNLSGCFYVLYLMDSLIGKTFKARRAHQLMNPFAHQLYFSILVSVQVARCMKFAHLLERNEDISFLDTFLQLYPPEKLAIPGPLLPFFKAICTYKVQNELFARVSPAFPNQAINAGANGRQVSHMTASILFPHVPIAASLFRLFHTAVQGSNDGAFYTGNKHWPFTLADANTPNGDYAAAVTLGGFTFAVDRNWSNTEINALTNPASRYRPKMPRDLYTNVHDNIDDFAVPPVPSNATISLQRWFCMQQMKWFNTFLAPMAAYSSLWIGSGSLADCSIDGPSVGAYTCRYQPSENAPTYTNPYPFMTELHFNLSTRMYTSQGSPEPVTEKMAAFTQIHGRLATDHPYIGTLDAASYRAGPVWDARPMYGPSTEDFTHESMQESLRRFIQPFLLKQCVSGFFSFIFR
uniref:Capsid protein n=1 Tax=Rosellinia necatrix partitivirus 19 TaxID=2699387 RepID=A0A6F8QHB8_9VIRU|nr:capsid protein [Rosellinia necatrix partitivirus 19]